MGWMIMAALVAFFIKGLCGFADALLFTTILSFTADNVGISPLILLLGYPSNIILIWRGRKQLDWKIWLPLTAMVAAGSIPGIFLLKNADARIIKVIFGFVVVLIGMEMLLRERMPGKSSGSKAALLVIGILSGILSGMYGIGALLAAYVNRVTESNQAFKANMCAVFLAENTIRIVLYACTGIITPDIFKRAVLLMPFMLLGILLGIKSSTVLDEKIVKKFVVLMLIFSGVMLVLSNVR